MCARQAAAMTTTVLVLVAALLPAQAYAQSTTLGGTFVASDLGPTKRFPDAAFDTVNDVYLVAWSGTPTAAGFQVWGRFTSPDGVPLGAPFPIATGTPTFAPRMAFSPEANAFLVTWVDESIPGLRIVGRLVQFSSGTPQFLTGDFTISQNGLFKHTESPPATAYSPVAREFLVSWVDFGAGGDIRVQRVGTAGQLLGGEILIAGTTAWEGLPTATYNSQQDEFYIAYMYEPPGGGLFIAGQRVKPGTGQLIGGRNTLYGGIFDSYPEVAYDPAANQYLAISWHITGAGSDVFGQLVDGNGNPVGSVIPVAANSFFEGGDGIGLAFNPVTGSYFSTFQVGISNEIWGAEVSGAGVPSQTFQVTTAGAGLGSFQPRVEADASRKRWLALGSVDFDRVVGQLVETTSTGPGPGPVPPPQPTSTKIDLSPTGAPNGSWFLAEGTTGGALAFDTYYLIANEHDVPVDVRAYFARGDDGFTVETGFTIPARTRRTVRLGNFVSAGGYSAVFQSQTAGRQIFVQRSRYWGPNWEGSAGSVATTSLSTTWLFAEGSRKKEFFDNFFVVFNPSSTQTATITTSFFRQAGSAPVTRQFSVPPQARATIDARTVSELAGVDFATRIDSNLPVLAERSMFWGPNWRGGTNSLGTPQAAPLWLFAEGVAAPRFDTYYTVLNPNPTDVTLNVRYLLETGPPVLQSHSLAGNSRLTIWLTGEVGLAGSVGAEIWTAGGESVVAERSVYWGNGWVEGTNVRGANAAAAEWHVPEGSTRTGFETFLLLANPTDSGVLVRVVSTNASGGQVPSDHFIPARERRTLYMNDATLFPTLVNTSFSINTIVLTPGGTIVVEEAIYWQRAGDDYWRGGSASFGYPGQ